MIESLDPSKCIGCGTCALVCPLDVFRIDEEAGRWRSGWGGECQTCYTCELECPVHAIRVSPWRKQRGQAW